MSRFNNPLENVRIAAPCKADWEQMMGTERTRFCGQCNLNVYNLSSMTRSEAEHLIASNEGRLCVRFYRRADGSILTKNCPVGLRAIQRRLSYLSKAITSALLTFFAGIGIYESSRVAEQAFKPHVMGTIAVDRKQLSFQPAFEPPAAGPAEVGGVSAGRLIRITPAPTKRKNQRGR
ncbi:MAG: hypothetical protein M3R68_06025 [Acidobacteriota bacterium]|nr:hypothetical protein [Acidobacteriota bacterium]